MEFINATKVSPLISRVQVKVCYVGQEPNRNGTVITREVAEKLGENLPGTPIVGYYNEQEQDFEGHNREVVVDNGKFRVIDTTRPYGFVDVKAPIWFQKFLDDGVEHEYLCTEGYIWTGIYEESQRIVDKGNNQSMELHSKSEKGFWTKDANSGNRIFIISDGLIEKLCVLGQNVEPCFEGSQIKSFSLTSPEFTEFKATMFSMISELKDVLSNKGGSDATMNNENNTPQVTEEQVPAGAEDYTKKDPKEEEEKDKGNNQPENNNNSNKDKEKDKSGSSEEEDKDKEKKKCKSYELTEIAEYVALQLQFSELQSKYSALEQENSTMKQELETLRTFKLATDRKDKQAMIDSFYMLSDEDKKDVVEHIDTYSLNDIEAKLSIICVRNKVDFSLEKEDGAQPASQRMFNLNNVNDSDDAPAWVQAVRQKNR